jgi:cellulose synthase operon protein YhjU
MGLWSFYFLGKFFLYYKGYIRFDFLWNILFLLFILVPLPKGIPLYRVLKGVKSVIGIIFAFLLAWYESWLPPLLYSIRQFEQIGLPSKEYIVRFLMDSFNPWAVLVLALILAFCIIVRNRIQLTPIVVILVLVVPLFGLGQSKKGLNGYLEEFYQSEAKRTVRFEKPKKTNADFDIIFLHICSLAWDDLKAVGLDTHTFFKQFDILFTNFNSVSSYTNPAALRLLLASCGQRKHAALFQEAPKECHVLEILRSQGYETYSAIDNDAPEFQFVEQIMQFGLADPPLDVKGLPIQQYSFDNTPIYDDLALLKKWWDIRQHSRAKKAAFYFDITTLHGGAHWAQEKDWWKRDRPSQYKEFNLNLFKNIESFFSLLEFSGKNFVVVFVPEHGMALRGSSMQPPDLRDIPLPQITLIPVGIKLIGKDHPRIPVNQEVITKPTSYLAISHLLASFLKQSPFEGGGLLPPDIISNIPETSFVSEHEDIKVVKQGQDYFMYGKDKKWTKLTSAPVQ